SRCAGRQFRLHRLKHSLIHDGLVLAGVDFASIDHFPNVEAIAQEVSKWANSKAYPPTGLTIAADLALGADASVVKILHKVAARSDFKVAFKDQSDRFGLLRHDHELLVDAGIAEGDRSSDPDALAFRGRDLIAHPFPDDLALELGKREE